MVATKDVVEIPNPSGHQDVEQVDGAGCPGHLENHEAHLFKRLWPEITDDNRLTLFGFRRFRTSHLLNLRYLEDEIHHVDREIYQAGLKLGWSLPKEDRLGIRHSKQDIDARTPESIDRDLVLKLRGLLKSYDDALAAFNQLMLMETFALADNRWQSNLREDLNSYEIYKTRMTRVDLPRRTDTRDPLRHYLRKALRSFRYFCCFESARSSTSSQHQVASELELNDHRQSFQNTTRIADFLARFIVATLASAFLVVPLAVLSGQRSHRNQLGLTAMFIVLFCLLVSLLSKGSNQEIVTASAAYTAVLVVFMAASPAAA